MGIKRFFLGILAGFVLNFSLSTSAEALSFADYVYQNVEKGNMYAVRQYLNRGYSIDAINSEGLTALCQAVADGNSIAYRRLIQLGASTNHRCMQRVQDQEAVVEERLTYYELEERQALAASSSKVSQGNDHTLAIAAGVLAAGGAVAAIASSGGGGGHHHHSKTCPEGQEMVDGKCVPIECPEGQILDGDKCYDKIDCPEGQQQKKDKCVPISCPEGQRLVNDKCVPIICPKNTHLVGNRCLADENIDIEHEGDEDISIISSEGESVYNLYSDPKYPMAHADISLHNKGNGDVYGMYAHGGDVRNSFVVGEEDGVYNPEPVGTANITIVDEGKGDLYGMYSHIADITALKESINAAGYNLGISYGNVDLKHTGGGATYGLMGDVRAYNTWALYGGQAYGNISIEGDGDIYGIYGYVAATNGLNPWTGSIAKGNINIKSTGDGDIYGMMISKDDIPGAGAGGHGLASWFAFNAYAGGGTLVEGTIDIHNTGNGNVYGMYGGQQLYNAMSYGETDEHGVPQTLSIGKINVTNLGNGDTYGMYIPFEDEEAIIANVDSNGSQSSINIINAGSGTATGMRGGKKTTIINSGEININNAGSGTAYGIYGERYSKISNDGNIIIKREAFTDSVDGTTHTPNGVKGGTAYGIYAEKDATVHNTGSIIITDALAGTGIYLEQGATLENTGIVRFNGEDDAIIHNGASISSTQDVSAVVDFDDMGSGQVVLGNGGQFFAKELSGHLAVSDKSVLGDFKDKYVLDSALQAQNVDDLKLASQSALFSAQVEENGGDGYNVVLNRRNFDEVVKDKGIAQFLEKNYKEGNNENLYDELKTAATVRALNQQASNIAGSDIIPGFRQEDALVYRHLSKQFNDNLFNEPNNNYIGGYKYINVSRDKDGTLQGNDGEAHAAYGLVKSKAGNGMVYGLGATISQIKSDYDNHSTRKNNTFSLWAPVGYDFGNGTQWYSKAYAGYSDGSYDRKTSLGKYSADTKGYQYGLSNELRHNIGLGGGFKFTPAAELNFLGIHQNGFDEGNNANAIKTDDFDSLSLEGGLGAYLTKEYQFNENHKLGIQIGGIYYVELLDPDEDIDARMQSMNGRYKIRHSFDDERAVLSARVNYNYKNITLYGLIEQEFGNYEGLVVDLGLQYNL